MKKTARCQAISLKAKIENTSSAEGSASTALTQQMQTIAHANKNAAAHWPCQKEESTAKNAKEKCVEKEGIDPTASPLLTVRSTI
jgi:hypothetical protein